MNKEKAFDELIIANKEIVFQNKEKDKRAAELAIADKELAFQQKEKGKRAVELIIANKELLFQNEQKEKRAEELVIANKELVFQNEEKEKRAAELIIANKELVYQNEEKEKRAAELIIANKELVFQNEEKEKRALEILHANRLYAFISQINQVIVHAKDEESLFNAVCRIAIDEGKFNIALMGIVDTATSKIKLTASCGVPESDIKMIGDFTYDVAGPIEKTLNGLDYYVINDLHKEQQILPKKYAQERGLNSCIFLSVKRSGKVAGIFNIYSSEINFFNEEEIALLKEVASDISFALDVFEKEKLKQKADEKLTGSELSLNQAQAIAHIGSWELDYATGIAFWSDELLRIYGLPPEDKEQSFKTWSSFIYPGDLEYVLKMTAEVKSTLDSCDLSYRILRRDGTIRYLYSQVRNKFNSEGTATGLYGVFHDVTEKKEAEEALRQSESNLRTIFETTSEGFILTDSNGIVKSFNNKAENTILLNVEKEIKVGDSIFDFIHESRKGNYKDAISKVLSGETLQYDYSYDRKSGDLRWFNFTVNPAYTGKDITGLSITSADITDRKIGEQKLIQSEKHSRDLFEQSIVGLALSRMDGTLADVNEAYAKIIGRTIEETLKLTYWEITPAKYHEQENKVLEQLMGTGKFINYEKEYIHKNGNLVPVRLSGNIIERDGEKFIWSSVEDITRNRKLEKAVETERDQFFHMFLKAPSLIGMLKSAQHVFEMANPVYLQLIGKKDVIGKTVAAVLPEVIEQGFIGILDSVYTTGNSYTGTEILVKLDKEGNGELTDTYLNFVYQAYKNHEGKTEGIFFFGNDITEQIESRKKVEKSEKFFKGVIESSDDMITILDPAGKTLYASPSVQKKFGYTYEECLNLNLSDVIHPDDALITQEVFMKVMTLPSVPMECPIIRNRKKDGTYIFVEGTITNFLETEGINAIVTNFRDITERKKADEKLIQSEKHSRNLFEQTVIGLALARMDGTLADVNEAYAKIIGRTIEETLKLTYWEITPEKYHEQENKVLEELTTTGKFINYEKEYIHKNGHLVPVRLSGNIIERDGEKFIWSTVEDVTERKKIDEENRFKANLLNTIGQAAIATNINGLVNYWNKAAEDIYGWTQEEALGKNIIDLTPSQASRDQAIAIMEDLKNGRTWSGEFRVRRKDGTDFPAWVTDAPIHDEQNILSGIIGISSDITEKKKLEELLDKTNRLAAIGSWEIDLVRGTVFWSDITKEIREVDKDFVPQLDIGISYFKEGSHKETISQKVNDCIENGTPWDEELEIITFKGNPKWVRTIGEGEFINGKCIRVYGSFQDIDKRKKAETEVLKVYEEKNIILESIGDGFYTLDKNWIVTYWNNQAEKMLGKTKEEMLGKNFWEMFPEAMNTHSYAAYLKAVTENSVQHFERFNIRFKGWFQISIYPSANGVSVYFQDITERQLAEQHIKADKNLLRTLIDNLPDTIYYKDTSARKLISNKFDYKVLGADTEQAVLGKTDLEISSHPNALMTYTQDMEILRTGIPLVNFEECFTTANNKPLWLLTSKLPLRNEDNEIIGLLGIGRDITKRKIVEEKLLEVNSALEKNIKQLEISNAELEQFAYVASHDLQEPLRMITSFLTLLEKKYSHILDDKGKQYIDFAVDGGVRMRQIILDLLEFSTIGRAENKTEEVDLNELIEGIIHLHSKQINETNAVFNIAKLPVLNISRAPMRQVFQNLISNSLKYHKDGVAPQISLSVYSFVEFWEFAISDNGIGIGEAYLDKIFIIFQRLHNKEKYSGTGIGLAITKKIIESTGGSIRVESEEGKGSTFYFTIPKK